MYFKRQIGILPTDSHNEKTSQVRVGLAHQAPHINFTIVGQRKVERIKIIKLNLHVK